MADSLKWLYSDPEALDELAQYGAAPKPKPGAGNFDVYTALLDFARGAGMGATTDVLGYPVDTMTTALRPLGYDVEKPVGGSDWLAERFTSPTGSKAEMAGRVLGGMLTPGPEDLMRMAGMLPQKAPVMTQVIYPHALDDAQKAKFRDWFGASRVVDEAGEPKPVYHGAQRADRIDTQFKKSRATSGPMAFFTDSPELASSYASGKSDTSLEVTDYADWFKYKPKGARSPQRFTSAWWYMTPEQRQRATEALYRIGKDEETSKIRVDPVSNLVGKDHIDFVLKEKHGNALEAAKDIWLDSGNLFNDEDQFMDVLKHMGVQGVEPDMPHVPRSGIYQTYLSIKNPLDTSILTTPVEPGSEADRVINALEQAGKRRRAKYQYGAGADPWDKNNKSGADWLQALEDDVLSGNTHAWTSIPDWVTDTLRKLGYDGIKDVSGKGGGAVHEVWIPFDETQVKSATGNRGTFDPTKKSIIK